MMSEAISHGRDAMYQLDGGGDGPGHGRVLPVGFADDVVFSCGQDQPPPVRADQRAASVSKKERKIYVRERRLTNQ